MSFLDTGIEMFTPEAVNDLKEGGTALKRDAKAVTRGLVSNVADFADFADILSNSKFGRFMERNATPQGLYRQVTGKPQQKDERFSKISDFLRNKYNGLLEKNLSPIEAQNVMEDFLEQGANHFDDAFTPGFWGKMLPAVIGGYADGITENASVEDIQKQRGTLSHLDGAWKENAKGIRTFEGVNRKNAPVKFSKRKSQPSARTDGPITL